MSGTAKQTSDAVMCKRLTFTRLEEDVGHGVDAFGGSLEEAIRRPVGAPDLGLALVGGSVDLDTGKLGHGDSCGWNQNRLEGLSDELVGKSVGGWWVELGAGVYTWAVVKLRETDLRHHQLELDGRGLWRERQ